MTTVDVVLTYSGTTTNPQLSMDNVPGYTFDNGGPDPCGDGWFPIDGQLLGNSYRASRFAEHGSRPEHGMCDWLTRSFQRVAWSVMAACIGEGLIPGVRMTKARLTRHVAVLNLEHMCCAAMPGCETTCQASTGKPLCHNYGFTAELHTTFVYRDTSDGFFFSSADDLWVCAHAQHHRSRSHLSRQG